MEHMLVKHIDGAQSESQGSGYRRRSMISARQEEMSGISRDKELAKRDSVRVEAQAYQLTSLTDEGHAHLFDWYLGTGKLQLGFLSNIMNTAVDEMTSYHIVC